jgi:non-ribosomal peptide synthetase component F
VCEDRRLTYRQLNSGPMAWRTPCAAWASAPGVLVGICMERSLEMVVGLLGILKAGGAYVPLGPGLSPRAPGLHAGGFPGAGGADAARLLSGLDAPGVSVIDLDEGWEPGDPHGDANPSGGATPETWPT